MIPAFLFFIIIALVSVLILGCIRIILIRRRNLEEQQQQQVEYISHVDVRHGMAHVGGTHHADARILEANNNPLRSRSSSVARFLDSIFMAEMRQPLPQRTFTSELFRAEEEEEAEVGARSRASSSPPTLHVVSAVVLINVAEDRGSLNAYSFPQAQNLQPLLPSLTSGGAATQRRRRSHRGTNDAYQQHEEPRAFPDGVDDDDEASRCTEEVYGSAEYICRMTPPPLTATLVDDLTNDDSASISQSVVMAEVTAASPRMVNQLLLCNNSPNLESFHTGGFKQLRVCLDDLSEAFTPPYTSSPDEYVGMATT